MTESLQHKECPLCFQSIRLEAKKCPYCHHWQTRWHTTIYHPASAMLAFVLPMGLLWVGAMYSFSTMFGCSDPTKFLDYRHQITVLSSTVHYEDEGEHPSIYVVGKIKNGSPKAWEDIQIEIQYFDEAGKLIDTAKRTLDYTVVLPGDEKAFRVPTKPIHPKEDYKSHKVFLRSGKLPN